MILPGAVENRSVREDPHVPVRPDHVVFSRGLLVREVDVGDPEAIHVDRLDEQRRLVAPEGKPLVHPPHPEVNADLEILRQSSTVQPREQL